MKTVDMPTSHGIETQLRNLYEEIMWLRHRPNITSSVARSWYTHACSERLKRHIRRFSGRISRNAINPEAVLILEHHMRMQKQLTSLVERHHQDDSLGAEEFIASVISLEEVHIVTFQENYEAKDADGDYSKTGIELIDFNTLDYESRLRLWKRMLKGRVSNHHEYKPNKEA